eukprot:UC4_evm1s197
MSLALYIVRHGETEWNRRGIIQGQSNSELSDLGKLQAQLVGKALKNVNFSFVFSSDLSRAKDTCQTILDVNSGSRKNVGEIKQGFGSSVACQERTCLREMAAGAREDRETPAELRMRAQTFQEEISELARNESAGRNVLVVSHGGWIRSFLKVLGSGGDIVNNCSITRVDVTAATGSAKYVVVSVNRCGHLESGNHMSESH